MHDKFVGLLVRFIFFIQILKYKILPELKWLAKNEKSK